jgi:cellulose synthase/poly-beta-1,6-N-acetylglucosamine synthase-like glycosyltransferase
MSAPGATFYYQPEVLWSTLLTQRRRWINGTFASFLFFFISRAKQRVHGGFFDQHKVGKSIRLVTSLWSLQLMQLILVMMAQAVFGSSGYVGLLGCAVQVPAMFGWGTVKVLEYGGLTIGSAEICIFAFFAVYLAWL